IQIFTWFGAGLQRPVFGVVLGNQRTALRLVVPRNTPALQHLACRRAKMHHIALCDASLALELNTDTIAHTACAPITACQVGTAYRLRLSGLSIAHRSGNAAGILSAFLESRTEP